MATESQQNVNTKSDEITLKNLILIIQGFIKYLLSKWLLILALASIGSVIGYLYALNTKPYYTASTTFVLSDENGKGGLGNLNGLASIAGMDFGTSSVGIFQGDNIFELYKTRKMLQQTLLTNAVVNGKTLALIDSYIKSNELRKNWMERPELLKVQFSADSFSNGNPYLKPNRLRDSILTIVISDISKNYLTVSKPDKKLSIIRVDVKARDENFAKAFNEQLVKNVNNFYIQTKTKKSLENVQIMQRKADSVRSVMNGAIYSAVAIEDATPNYNPTRQVRRVAPAQKAQYSAETNKAILSSLVQNLEMSKLALMKETPLLEVIDQPVYPLTKYKFGKAKGIIFGALIFGFLSIIYLLFSKVFKTVMA